MRATFGLAVFAMMTGTLCAQPLDGLVFVVDPGHAVLYPDGRPLNPGAVAPDGTRENEIALKVGDLLAQRLRRDGARVIMTRTPQHPYRHATSAPKDNRARAALANRLHATAFIAIHCDSSPDPAKRGTSVFWLRANSEPLAQALRVALAPLGLGESEFRVRDLAVTSEARVPAVLVELGFISNPEQLALLRDETFEAREAAVLEEAILATFGRSERG